MPVPVAYSVVPEPNRRFPCVPDDLSFLVEKAMPSRSRQDKKETLQPKILEVCRPRLLLSISSPFGHGDPVPRQDLLVREERVFVLGDGSRHIEPVAVSKVTHSQLLQEAFFGRSEIPVHTPPFVKLKRDSFQAQSLKSLFSEPCSNPFARYLSGSRRASLRSAFSGGMRHVTRMQLPYSGSLFSSGSG